MEKPNPSMVILTGAAGFIGFHLGSRLLRDGYTVVGFDSFNDFYDPGLKRRNAADLVAIGGERFRMVEGDLRHENDVEALFQGLEEPVILIHLAAMAGVRPSLENPLLYQEVNVTGTYRLLETARRHTVAHYVFGSSSSVYGASGQLPFAEDDPDLDPLSPYAATKLLGEQIAYVYQVCHGIPATCLRFFTVFGPRQRPEMAIHKFTRAILEGKEIQLFGDGTTTRDYTYVDDIVDGVCRALVPGDDFRVFNLGGGHRITLREMVGLLEEALGRKARVVSVPVHPGDMVHTLADITRAERDLGYRSVHTFQDGLRAFVAWFGNPGEARA
jgi:UDP-glucuronate 4-epimerase